MPGFGFKISAAVCKTSANSSGLFFILLHCSVRLWTKFGLGIRLQGYSTSPVLQINIAALSATVCSLFAGATKVRADLTGLPVSW